jgi:phospholipid transport system substrate-binding protein
MIRSICRCAVFAAFTFAVSLSVAQEVSPDVVSPDMLLRTVTEEVITLVKQNRGHLNPARTNQTNVLVERKVLPLFDFSRMTQLAVGRNWTSATAEQRNALTTEFSMLLVRTYITAIRNYRDQNIDFQSLDIGPDTAQATVKSVIKQSGTPQVTIDYDMHKTTAGWKVYEIRMDGVNLIANYRGTFAARLRDGGVAGLIHSLAEKNRQSNYSGSEAHGPSPSENPA